MPQTQARASGKFQPPLPNARAAHTPFWVAQLQLRVPLCEEVLAWFRGGCLPCGLYYRKDSRRRRVISS